MAEQALVEAPQNEVAVQSESVAMISMIERAASNPDVDPDKLERLYALHERMQQRSSEKAFYAAMAEMQPGLPVIEHTREIKYEKDGKTIKKGTYTPWEDIDEKIRPIYTEFGFALSFRVKQAPNTPITVTAVVMHRDGHKEETEITLPPDPSGKKNNVQAVGSAITYAKRYAACAALNITTRGDEGDSDDDNGETAGQPMNPYQARQHELWEKLETEMKKDNRSRQELRTWYDRMKQHRKEWHAMPGYWKALFFNECFTPYGESLPEVVDS